MPTPVRLIYFFPPARWGSLNLNKGATASPSSFSSSPHLLPPISTPLCPPSASSVGTKSAWTDPTHVASSGCSGGGLDPNICQRECRNRCQKEWQNIFTIYVYVYIYIPSMFIHLFISYLFVYLFIYLFVYLCIYLFIHLHIYIYEYLYIYIYRYIHVLDGMSEKYVSAGIIPSPVSPWGWNDMFETMGDGMKSQIFWSCCLRENISHDIQLRLFLFIFFF